MEIAGNIRKMRTVLADPVEYYLPLGREEVSMNVLLGRKIEMEFLGEINCLKCGQKTPKSFAQGYCYPCFVSAPETEDCVLRPELCRAHLGEARDMEYAREHCLIDHIVYLSLTSDSKVGVTRNTQVPARWIDQGAVKAVELARTPDRYTAGLIELALKNHMKDKTNWRGMLKNEILDEDLAERKKEMLSLLPAELSKYRSASDRITFIEYPVLEYPKKIVSANFDTEPLISGTLEGIKGQYLLIRGNIVLNIRKFGGYRIAFRTGD